MHLGVNFSSCALIDEDGVPAGKPKEGTATMLAIEVAKDSKEFGKGSGKGKTGAKKVSGNKRKATKSAKSTAA